MYFQNCGFPQGKLVRRGKIMKNTGMQYYTWKDFNIGINMEMQGIVFHITDCDSYTREFLLSNGIELNHSECMPIDPVNTDRMIQRMRMPPTRKTPPVDDKLRRYLEYQGMVLHFDCVLDETDRPNGELMTYKLFYYLEDDTISVKELKENREGRYHFPLLMKRNKLPKNWKQQPIDFPSIFMEKGDKEISEYYSPKDLKIGETIYVYGRKFLLLNCDKFTRDYYERVLKDPQTNRLEVRSPEKAKPKTCLPNYLGLGTPEDSMASCYGLIPKSPRKDIINYLINTNKFLRYGCALDTAHPEDKERRFIMMYSLADHTIQIIELPLENSGIQGGRFLSARKITRPDSDPNDPIYYTAKDLYIGATIHVYSHRFVINSADLYVYRYMQNYPEQFTPESIQHVRNYLLLQGHLKEDLAQAIEKEILEQKITEPLNEDPRDMEEALQKLTVTGDPQNLPPSEEEQNEFRKPKPESDRDICPYFVIPEDEKRESYHRAIESEYLEDPNQPRQKCSTSKNVHFND